MKKFKLLIVATIVTVLFSCKTNKATTNLPSKDQTISFYVDLNDRSNDTFKIEVSVPELTKENSMFQFAATAPGTYMVMDIGRFVKTFKAYDVNGDTIQVNRLSVNQFEFSQPSKVTSIKYEISETFDTPITVNPVYPMAGTSIEENHALINGQAVFGYIKGNQGMPIDITIDYPEKWISGTPLELNNNIYKANNYDHLVDSPILLGDLTKATMDISGTAIEIYTYSEQGMITSEMILETLTEMLASADLFLNGLPVDNYTFLFHFETNNLQIGGAWEHSYSSEYTLQEKPWNQISDGVKDITAHEFFHIVTPLNIHSEVIQEFNFIEPVPSRHLWLYEGVTEWASHMMQFRSGDKSTADYFKMLQKKVLYSSNYYDTSYSLLELSLNSFTDKGHRQYGNIYMKGSLVAGLLDIRLLELSNGEVGLIDVINKLAKKYGPNKPFTDATFFEEFANYTYPEISEFIDLYIKQATALPFEEYYNKIGINYNSEKQEFTINSEATKEQIDLRNKWMKQLN